MRIIAGSKKGMKLFAPKGSVSRPITDRVKESLFSVLANYGLPQGKVVADLFCGAGSMGLEALSRGASFATFVEQDLEIAAVLKKNIEKGDFNSQARLVNNNAYIVGAQPLPGLKKYDLVFVDPPYKNTTDISADAPVNKILEKLTLQITSDSMVIIRMHRQSSQWQPMPPWSIIDKRLWGTMVIFFLELKQTTDDK